MHLRSRSSLVMAAYKLAFSPCFTSVNRKVIVIAVMDMDVMSYVVSSLSALTFFPFSALFLLSASQLIVNL